MQELNIADGERLYPRSTETVRRFNELVGAEVLTWHLFRHALTYGTKVRSGHRIRIPHVRFGRRLWTSLEAISRWARAVAEAERSATARRDTASQPQRPRAETASRSAEAAKRLLDKELG